MTELRLNFADQDRQLAKPIAWLLLGKDASTDADSIEEEFSILVDAIPSDPDADRKRTLLVRFGLDRWQDAQTADPRMARDVVARQDAPRSSFLAAALEALRLRNEAIEPLQRALSALREAEGPLAKADKADEANRKLVEERVRDFDLVVRAARSELRPREIRTISWESLQKPKGIVNLGGNADEDCKALYDG